MREPVEKARCHVVDNQSRSARWMTLEGSSFVALSTSMPIRRHPLGAIAISGLVLDAFVMRCSTMDPVMSAAPALHEPRTFAQLPQGCGLAPCCNSVRMPAWIGTTHTASLRSRFINLSRVSLVDKKC